MVRLGKQGSEGAAAIAGAGGGEPGAWGLDTGLTVGDRVIRVRRGQGGEIPLGQGSLKIMEPG